VARNVRARLDVFFDRLNASIAEPADQAASAASAALSASLSAAAAADDALLLVEDADMHSVHDSLLRLMFLVRADSAVERALLEHIGARIERSLATVREADVRSNSRTGMAMLQLLHFLAAFHTTFARSDAAARWSAANTERPERETIQCPDTACSVQFLNAHEKDLLQRRIESAASGASGWSSRVSWSASLLLSRTLLCVQDLTAMVSALEKREASSEALKVNTALVDLLGEVLGQSNDLVDAESKDKLRSLKYTLLAHALHVLITSKCFALPSADGGEDRAFIWGLVRACVTNVASEEFEQEGAAAVDGKEEEATVSRWAQAAGTSGPLPAAIASWLVRQLVVAQLERRKPAALSVVQWKGCVTRFHVARWRSVRHLLTVHPATRRALALSLLDVCVDALDGSTEHFVEDVFHCTRLLLGPYITAQLQLHGADSSPEQQQQLVLSKLELVHRASWSAFKDVQGHLPSFEGVLAFLGVVFEATSTDERLLPANHTQQGPFRRMLSTLLEYGNGHSRFLLYVSCFCSALWLGRPSLLPLYTEELQRFCLYRSDSGSEVELIEEKVHAFETAHMIHAFSESTRADGVGEAGAAAGSAAVAGAAATKDLLKLDALRRGESLVRCAGLHLLQLLPSVLSSLPCTDEGARTRASVERFVLQFARACTEHPCMQSEKGAMLGEGNDDFVVKLYLWQTLCIFCPTLRAIQDPKLRQELRAHLSAHAWAWFERALSPVLRQQMELFLVQLYVASPEQLAEEVTPRIDAFLARPTLLASVLVVLGFSTLALRPALEQGSNSSSVDRDVALQQARRTLRLLHPFVGTNFGHVRLVVQFMYHRIATDMLPAPEAAAASEAVSFSDASREDAPLQQSLMRFLNSDPVLSRLRERQAAYFAMFSPLAATVEGLLCFGSENHYFVQKPAMDAIASLQGEFLTGRREHYDDSLFQTPGVGAAADETPEAATEQPAQGGANFQQKIELAPLMQLAALGADGADDEQGSDAAASVGLRSAIEQRSSAPRASVIVVASFVSKLPNLAGLARTCEIFQSAKLMLADTSVTSHPDFTAVSVTAQRWLPIEQLAPADVGRFLRERQDEGYTCVALEQSAQSVPLPRYQFPRRLVIVLGAEKQGVPVELLNQVDTCVEIPQRGILRSLNVHVSASILLWEYQRQDILGLLADE